MKITDSQWVKEHIEYHTSTRSLRERESARVYKYDEEFKHLCTYSVDFFSFPSFYSIIKTKTTKLVLSNWKLASL